MNASDLPEQIFGFLHKNGRALGIYRVFSNSSWRRSPFLPKLSRS